jgi:hypothetical protein
MTLLRAFYAFYRALLERECEHPHISARPGDPKSSGYCPDCGYLIEMRWTLCRCRTCGSKRYPRKTLDGRIEAQFKYCQHCGQADYQLLRKERIHLYEMPYAILGKEINYDEERPTPPRRKADNPFEIYHSLNIVEGEVLSKEEYLAQGRRPFQFD